MLHGVDAGRARSVHRIRVASRRLRELLPVLQLERDVAHRIGRRLRRVTRQLGPLREEDALIALLEEMRRSGRYHVAAVSCVLDALTRDRMSRRRQMSLRTVGADLRDLGVKLEKVSRSLGASEVESDAAKTTGWRWAIDARIGRRAEKLKRAVASAGNVYLADRVHAVRIALKKFRYAVELRNQASPDPDSAKRLAALKRRQDLLGRLHDRQVLIGRVRDAQASLERPDLQVWRGLDAMLASLENECRRMHARYVRDAADLVALCEQIAAAGEDVRARQHAVQGTMLPA
jgi:CHAD domain-containing protein